MRVFSRFLTAATHPAQFPPPALPEVAFLGRSNVGKSKLINSLLNSKVARISSRPGRTQSINFFEVRWAGKPTPELVFTDLPGYGYARVPTEVSAHWPTFIEPYLRERRCLSLCLALVDPNIPPQDSDKQLIEFLRSVERPFRVIATKSDRLSGNQLQSALKTVAEELTVEQVMAYSSRTGSGRDELWQEIRTAVDSYQHARA